jgi:hypothetical protein
MWYRTAQNNHQDWAAQVANYLETQPGAALSLIEGSTYHHFTQRNDVKKQILEDKNFDKNAWKNLWVNSLIKVAGLLSSDWSFNSHPDWSQFSLKGKKKPANARNYKVYFTAKNPLGDFQGLIQTLYDLGKKLQNIQTELTISFKVSTNVQMLAIHVDTIVIHFADPNIVGEVQQAISAISKKNSLKAEDRDKYLRTTIGRDSTTSDTAELSQRFARNVVANKDYILSLKDDPGALSSTLLDIWRRIDSEGLHRK